MISYIIIPILSIGLIIQTKRYLTLKKQCDNIIDNDIELNRLFHNLELNFEHLKEQQNDFNNWYRSYCVGCYRGSVKDILRAVISDQELRKKLLDVPENKLFGKYFIEFFNSEMKNNLFKITKIYDNDDILVENCQYYILAEYIEAIFIHPLEEKIQKILKI